MQTELTDALRGELVRQARLSLVGELTNLMAHDFNNSLNGIVLHLAVIGMEAPENLRGELGVIRDLVNGAAAQIRTLQEYNRRSRSPLEPVDLARVVEETTAWLAGLARQDEVSRSLAEVYFPDGLPAALASGAVTVEARIEPGLPPVLGTRLEVARLLRLLIAGAAQTAGTGPATVMLRGERADRKVALRVEQPSTDLSAEAIANLFDPFAALRQGGPGAELAVCKAIVRRMQGSAHADRTPEGGLVVSIDLQAAP
jgi:C4-dicarboxylate-specific signal transduction histidine kinase